MSDQFKRYAVLTASDQLPPSEMSVISCVHLIYRIGSGGVLQRAQSNVIARKNVMGIYDGGGLLGADYEKLSRDIFQELTRRGYTGVLFDFPARAETIPALELICSFLAQKKATVFLPYELSAISNEAKIIIPASVSGGSLRETLESLCSSYSPQRLCVEISRDCSDFLMPSYQPNGTTLSSEQLKSIIEKYTPAPYFSDKMGCKYFTYRNGAESHFVLFDDADTAAYKVKLADTLGMYGAFVLYSEWGTQVKEILSSR